MIYVGFFYAWKTGNAAETYLNHSLVNPPIRRILWPSTQPTDGNKMNAKSKALSMFGILARFGEITDVNGEWFYMHGGEWLEIPAAAVLQAANIIKLQGVTY